MSDSDESTKPTDLGKLEAPSKLTWSTSVELMLANWGDQAKSFEWMHAETYAVYNYKAKLIVITSNILTAVSGLSNVIAGGTE